MMDPALDAAIAAINFALAAIFAGIFGVWVYFLTYMAKSFRLAPRMEDHYYYLAPADGGNSRPRVSVILPARNEEKYIASCLDTLLAQDYPNFEVIAINDSSTDRTGEIIQSYAARDSRIVYVSTPAKPEGWAGKNWACHQGYKKASGEYLFFTDADTKHEPDVMSLAVGRMLSEGLDALTAMPRLLCNDFWTKVTLPALSTFLHTRFSPLRVNNPKQKTGYFFGSFFVITKKTYEAVGTHEGVRQELVEDGALGSKVKAAGFRMKMVRGEKHVEAIWARDFTTLWHGLRRLVIPLYHQDHAGAHLIATAVFFIMFAPFLFLAYTVPVFALAAAAGGLAGLSATILLGVHVATIMMLLATTAVQSKHGVMQSPAYALGSPLSGALIYLGFASAIVDARKKGAVSWRGRQYTVSEKQDFMH
ncbi:glycosyltransferase [Nitrososphaera viennensis]|uniref:Glycosyltransferase family 2 protein n=2 Tax=Nitrososphaera viennensis TaxID=1034015 RepID=A0A977IGA1_9ARCH|nr:glycosyltransferase [Nitrososphaera viennensis]AIC15363.1 putative glycosyltransferase family 2 [Nitrososphaera viennensis EN76]UVS70260.1 glycosyltransferase family 2 protein [Nitrososphaera viennensis]